ncbi:MAG: bacillithiol biosynthesis cysteine-adding enzyme BshC [Pyrinomonadaceae bacterium]
MVKSLPFADIPGQSRIFLDYLSDPRVLKKFYPNAVASPLNVSSFQETVLTSYTTDRSLLCDALTEINAGAGDATLGNIELLRRSDTVAIVTGQQAGLFTGPLYTIYKALSAIKLAGHLRSSGTNAVPVFWVASEDHDLDEIDHANILKNSDGVASVSYRPQEIIESASVGDIVFDQGIQEIIEQLTSYLPNTEFTADLNRQLRAAYSSGKTYGTSFTKLILSLLGKYGLVVIDPLNTGIKDLASPIYTAAVEHADEIVRAIRTRSLELEQVGYTPQVLVEEDYFPLFWHDETGRRIALKHTGDGMYRVKGEKRQLHRDELLAFAKDDPRRLSPGVMLRPVVQDYLLPTLCYFGGGAEIAYFAQNSEAYRILGRPVTPIFHRQSFTVIEPRERRNLDRFRWDLKSLFQGKDAALLNAAERELAPDLARLFADVEELINGELNRLDQRLADADPTIAASLATRRKKIVYHLKSLREKTLRSEMQKDETMRRRIDNLFDSLLPNGVLQERELNVVTFLNKYGPAFTDWIYNALDLTDKGHRIVEI